MKQRSDSSSATADGPVPNGVPLVFEVASRPSLLPLALPFYGVMLAIAMAWAFWSGDSLMLAGSSVGGLGDVWDLAADVAAGVIAGLAVIGLSREVTGRTQWGDTLADALAGAIGNPTLVECILLALASGIAEEALFRGALQPQVGLWAASLLFGLAHFAPSRELWPWMLFAVATGVMMGALFEWTGNLIAPMVAHALINAVNLRLLALRKLQDAKRPNPRAVD